MPKASESELQQLPPVFTTSPDAKHKNETVKIGCFVSDDGKQVQMMAVDVSNTTFLASMEESDLNKVKPSGVNWKLFFGDIEKAFNGKSVKTTNEGATLTCSFKTGGIDTTFHLPKVSEQLGALKMAEKLYDCYKLRNTKEPEKSIDEFAKKDEDLQKKVKSLEEEKTRLRDIIANSEQDEKSMMEQYSVLQSELAVRTETFRKECAAAGKDPQVVEAEALIDPDFNGCVGRQPLGALYHREYDPDLLKLIKSKFLPAENQEEVDRELDAEKDKWLKVIRPITKNDFTAQLKALPETERWYVMKVMEKVDMWDYDVWTIQDMTKKGALFYTAYALFCRWEFFRKFNVDEEVAINFFSQVEGGYHPNPYHNSMHGADVLHIVHFILGPGGLKETAQLSDEDCFASLIAGMIHDYDHPGLNNNFHVKVQSYLATLYNDRSILENHHCAEVFDLMKNPRLNILACLNDDQRKDMRETVIEMVLSTDMGLHAKIFGNWKRRIGVDKDLHKKKDDQRLALSMTIKMADISNCGRPEHLYLKWGTKLAEEFFLQGDNERNRGDPVSPFMDRFAPSMAKSQIAFMNYIVIPMFESISEYLPAMHFSVDHCESNKSYWASNDDSV